MTTKKTNHAFAVSTLFVMLLTYNVTMMPINATTENDNSIPEMPEHAFKVQELVDKEIDIHPDWIGLVTWDEDSAKIAYLGPSQDNPYRLTQSNWAHTPPIENSTAVQEHKIASNTISKDTTDDDNFSSLTTLYTTVNVFDSIYWREFLGGNDIYKIEHSFPLKASTTNGVNLYHWLDAKNSNTEYWLQVSAVYDKAKLFDTTEKWYANFDLWDTTDCTEDPSFPIQSEVSFTTDDTATSYIRADSEDGKYKMGVTSEGTGAAVTFTLPNDNGNNIDVGRTTGSGCVFPSGAHVEEQSTSSGTVHYYGTTDYVYGFYETSTSSKETSVYDYYGKEGSGGSVTEYTNPAKLRFSCTGALTCP